MHIRYVSQGRFLVFFLVVVFGDEGLLHKLAAKEDSNLRVERSLLVIACWHSQRDANKHSPTPAFNHPSRLILLSGDKEV